MRSVGYAIQAEHVSFRYHQNAPAVLDDVSIAIPDGKVTAIAGLSGSGKSTLLHAICGVISHGVQGVFEGTVQIKGEDSRSLTLPQIARKVGLVFQNVDNQLFLPTVEEELAFGPENYCLPGEQIREIINEVLTVLHIEYLRYRNPSTLSGGEKRIAAIGSVLSLNPDVIVLDEPFSELDEKNRILLQSVILDLKKAGKTIVLAEHSLEALALADVLYILSGGKMIKRLEGESIYGVLQGGFHQLLLS